MLNIEIMHYLDQKLDSINMDLAGDSANIFDNNMPEKPDTAIMVESTGGSAQNMSIPFLKNPTIRILIRGQNNPLPPKRLAKNIIYLIGNFSDGFFAPPGSAWNSSTIYSVKTVVEHNGILYMATEKNTDSEPGVSSAWLELEGHFVTRCQAVQDEPANVSRDEDNRVRYSVNFELRTRITNLGVS